MIVQLASFISLLAVTFGVPSVRGVDGKLHHPLQEAAGKPIVLVFVSHDCPVCNIYAPELGRLIAQHAGNVQFDIVYCDLKLSASEAEKHAKEFGISHATLLLDPTCRLATFSNASVTPQAVLYDATGHKVYSGRIDDRYLSLGQQRPAPTSHDLAKALDAVLNHQRPKPAAGPPVGCFIVFPNPS